MNKNLVIRSLVRMAPIPDGTTATPADHTIHLGFDLYFINKNHQIFFLQKANIEFVIFWYNVHYFCCSNHFLQPITNFEFLSSFFPVLEVMKYVVANS